jgi:hypothetical protein
MSLTPGAMREVVRTVTVSYPVPFMLAALLTFALGCFGLAAAVQGEIAWLFGSIGGLASLIAFGFGGYAVLRKPELLRSERYSLMQRYMDVLDNSDMDAAAQERLGKLISGFAEEPRPKKALVRSRPTQRNNDG